MKKGNCIECDKPLFDQDPDEKSQLCDNCVKDLNDSLWNAIDKSQ